LAIEQSELLSWVEQTNLPPLLSNEDVGKEGKITDVDFVDTRFGRRLRLQIDIDGTAKNALLSRTYAAAFVKQFGPDTAKWKNLKVRITTVLVQTPQGVKEKVMPVPLPAGSK